MLDQENAGRNRSPAAAAAQPVAERAGEVAQTAKQEAMTVVGEAGDQAKRVAGTVRERVREQAHTQHGQVVDKVRQASGQLREMAQDKQDSPAGTFVNRIADRGERLADYLGERGPDGLLTEARDFARRRPGAFLLAAVAAGFVVGRAAKGMISAQQGGSTGTTGSVPTYTTTPAVGLTGTGYGYDQPAGYVEPAYTETGYAAQGGYTDPTLTPTPVADPLATGGGVAGQTYVSGQTYPVDEEYQTRPGGGSP